jgi:hypothetical protein
MTRVAQQEVGAGLVPIEFVGLAAMEKIQKKKSSK